MIYRFLELKSYKIGRLICMFGVMLFYSCASPTFRLLEKPIRFDQKRKQLSLDYLETRYGVKKDSAFIEPKIVVIHWTAIPTLEQSFNAMNPAELPGSRKNIGSASSLNVSAHFLIDRDGTIFKLLPDNAFARHVIGLNNNAIGIENVGGSNAPLTRVQLKANEALVRYLAGRYDIEYLIGHYEYRSFEGNPLWKEKDPNYRTEKIDPGPAFMKKIRIKLKDLDLKGPPNN